MHATKDNNNREALAFHPAVTKKRLLIVTGEAASRIPDQLVQKKKKRKK